MKMKKVALLLPAILMWSFVATSPSSARDNCLSAGCHDGMKETAVVHQPVADGECAGCHRQTDHDHPGEKGAFELVAGGAALCSPCHGDVTKGQAHVHTPVAKGECTDCHNPHGAGYPHLLDVEGGKLCLQCHEDVATARYVHGPVAAGGCRYCHQAHGSAEPAQLKAHGSKVCFPCHGGIEKTINAAVSPHAPVAAGVCWDCHTPHGSNHRPFLKGSYPKAFYTSYREESFALCLGCHDKSTFEYDLTSEATGFRNGIKNLHVVHVNKPTKGRVCKTCHAVHGGDQERLVWRFTPEFGAWDIPLRFVKTETGGTCFVGCHNPKSYDRLKTVVNQ